MKQNILLLTDSYKFTHWKQYPPKTETIYSYFESRGGMFKEITFFGLQYILKEYLEGSTISKQNIDEAEEIVTLHLGPKDLFNRKGWEHILKKHNGRLPVSIKAVPEGSAIPTNNVLITIENTDPECYWLTNYLETLLVQTWYPCTVATLSREIKKLILSHLEKTGDPNLIDFKLHDFGFRGVSSVESAGIGGAAHLINFKGTDTVAAIDLIKKFYKCNMAGFSIPAAEHSTITSWGQENEHIAMANMLEQFKESPLIAVVSDSFDIFKACKNLWGEILHEKVNSFHGTVVIRPDSGDPISTILKVLEILGDKFGTITNKKGYKTLNPKVRIIQGDGVDLQTIGCILNSMTNHEWSADNIAFGMGGALLQKLNRDTQKFAFKCSSITIDGKEKEVFKNPVTDQGKVSKKGRLKLVKIDRRYSTMNHDNMAHDELVEVFRNGDVIKEYDFESIRKRSL